MNKLSILKCVIAAAIIAVAALVWMNVPSHPDVPDFKSMTSVPEKKKAFFSYFKGLADKENAQILSVRDKIESGLSQSELQSLANTYRLELSDPASEKDIADLLSRVDIVPSSLVLAQAAIESAWGTSRFAREGYNYFGQWCFSKGCGIVPSSRNAGASHEVRTFDSPQASVKAYMLNLNSHPTYKVVRQLRAQARAENNAIHGCVLAAGLSKYAERGQHYIEEIRQLIRVNDLTPNGEAPCAAAAKAKA